MVSHRDEIDEGIVHHASAKRAKVPPCLSDLKHNQRASAVTVHVIPVGEELVIAEGKIVYLDHP